MLEHSEFIFQSHSLFQLPGWGISPYAEYFSLSVLTRCSFSGPRLTRAWLHECVNIVFVTIMKESPTHSVIHLEPETNLCLERQAWKSVQKISSSCSNGEGVRRTVSEDSQRQTWLNGESYKKEGRSLQSRPEPGDWLLMAFTPSVQLIEEFGSAACCSANRKKDKRSNPKK